MAIDPAKFTVGKLVEEISDVENVERLKEILVAEEKNKNRKGALEGIQERIESVESLGPSGIAAPTAWHKSKYWKTACYLLFIGLAIYGITYLL